MKKVLLIALAITIAIIVLVTLISYPKLSFADFERSVPLPDVEDIEYVEYRFTPTGEYYLTISIDVADYAQILELVCEKRTYEYYGSVYDQAGANYVWLKVYTEAEDTSASFAVKYSQSKDGYYTLRSGVYSDVMDILNPYMVQAMEEYDANNAG